MCICTRVCTHRQSGFIYCPITPIIVTKYSIIYCNLHYFYSYMTSRICPWPMQLSYVIAWIYVLICNWYGITKRLDCLMMSLCLCVCARTHTSTSEIKYFFRLISYFHCLEYVYSYKATTKHFKYIIKIKQILSRKKPLNM